MNNFIQKYYFFSVMLLTSMSTLSMDRILSLGTPTKSDISNAIVYCARIDSLKKESVLENIKKPVDIIKHDYCLTTLPLELQYKIFNQLPSHDKNVLMQTCSDFHNLGKISPENLRFFVFDPTLIGGLQDFRKLAQVEFATDDYYCNSDMIVRMNKGYAAHRQLYIVDLLKEKYQAVDNSINNGLSVFNLLKNCYRLKDHCIFLEIKALGNFTGAIYDQCRLEAAMDTETQKAVGETRTLAKKSISITSTEKCAKFRLFALGTWFFFASLYGAGGIIALTEKLK